MAILKEIIEKEKQREGIEQCLHSVLFHICFVIKHFFVSLHRVYNTHYS